MLQVRKDDTTGTVVSKTDEAIGRHARKCEELQQRAMSARHEKEAAYADADADQDMPRYGDTRFASQEEYNAAIKRTLDKHGCGDAIDRWEASDREALAGLDTLFAMAAESAGGVAAKVALLREIYPTLNDDGTTSDDFAWKQHFGEWLEFIERDLGSLVEGI